MTEHIPVLVVDDEPAILRLLALELPAHGFEVITAASAGEALEAFGARPFEAVLLDTVLPGRTGLEVLATIREQSDVPVVLVTAMDREGDRDAGLRLGATDYVVKPYTIFETVARIQRALGGGAPNGLVLLDGVVLDLMARVATRDGRPISLRDGEWGVLAVLASPPGRRISITALLTGVCGQDHGQNAAFLRARVESVRSRLERDQHKPMILLSSDEGYCLAVAGEGGTSG